MRTVTLDISKLGLVVGDAIKVQLVNSIGKLLLSSSGYMLDSTTITTANIFEISLLENEYIDSISNYKIILPSTISFTFKVPVSQENNPHDLLSLMRIGNTKDIINEDTKSLDSEFVKKLDLYFSGENPHFNKTQKNVVELYSYYADNVLKTTSTIDVMQLMDEYLFALVGEI